MLFLYILHAITDGINDEDEGHAGDKLQQNSTDDENDGNEVDVPTHVQFAISRTLVSPCAARYRD